MGAVPGTNISTYFGTGNANNDIYYYGLADNAWYDGTPTLPAKYSNYTFSVSVQKAKLKIIRTVGSSSFDMTGQTTNVIVGEQIALSCQFDDGTIAPITNFQWTVPGTFISNYVANSTSGTVYPLTNSAAFTNSGITYYWVDGSGESLLEVQCTVIAKGVTMTAKAKFNVVRPAPAFTATINDVVSLTCISHR